MFELTENFYIILYIIDLAVVYIFITLLHDVISVNLNNNERKL